jgi:hypothetical protein
VLGVNDPQIILAYVVTLLFTLACILYGLLKWNSDGGE